jgi:hypothetical protein
VYWKNKTEFLMIKSNLMSARPYKSSPQAAAALQATKGVKAKLAAGEKKTADKNKGGSGFGGNFLFMLFLLLIAAIVYLQLFGIPGFLRGTIPQDIVDILGLSEETTATKVLREAGAPQLTARGISTNDPAIPVNGSVEEVVKTMRPDIYFTSKVLTDYKEQALSNRIPYQKQAFHIMLSTFYKATPDGDGVGYLDLAYQAPNFYFARVIAQDSRTRNFYREQLRSKVIDFIESDSVTARDGSVEFSVHGSFQQPKFEELKTTRLVHPSRIRAEVLALRNLAVANQIRLAGLEKPVEEEFGTYRRVTIRTTTEADYPSLLNFAEALQKSDIEFGVQQFASRPFGSEKMQSALEFVLYAAMK